MLLLLHLIVAATSDEREHSDDEINKIDTEDWELQNEVLGGAGTKKENKRSIATAKEYENDSYDLPQDENAQNLARLNENRKPKKKMVIKKLKRKQKLDKTIKKKLDKKLKQKKKKQLQKTKQVEQLWKDIQTGNLKRSTKKRNNKKKKKVKKKKGKKKPKALTLKSLQQVKQFYIPHFFMKIRNGLNFIFNPITGNVWRGGGQIDPPPARNRVQIHYSLFKIL